MTFWKLKCFLAVADEKSISAAAKKMPLSQPPLSRHIKALEDELGTPLFIRSASGLVLTDAGKLLYARGKEILSLYSQTVSEIRASSKTENKIIIGANDGGRRIVSPVLISHLKSKYKNTEIVQYEGICEEIAEALFAQKIDIAILRAPLFFDAENFDVIELGQEKWIALMSQSYHKRHNWQKSIPLEDLLAHPLIFPSRPSLYLPLLKALTIDEKPPNIICYYFEKEKAVELANEDLGISIVPSCVDSIVDNHDYVKKEIEGMAVPTCYVAVKHKGECKSEALRSLWEHLAHKGFVY